MKTEEVEAEVGSIYRATALDFEGYKAVKEFIDVNVVEDMGDIVIEYEKVLVESFELEPKELELTTTGQVTKIGYLDSSHQVAPGKFGERMTEILDLEDTHSVFVVYDTVSKVTRDGKQAWVGVTYYDKNKKPLTRIDDHASQKVENVLKLEVPLKRTTGYAYFTVSARWQKGKDSAIQVQTNSNGGKVTVTAQPANAKDKSFTLDHTEAIDTFKLSDTEFLVWKNDDTKQVVNVVANDGGGAKATLPVKQKVIPDINFRLTSMGGTAGSDAINDFSDLNGVTNELNDYKFMLDGKEYPSTIKESKNEGYTA